MKDNNGRRGLLSCDKRSRGFCCLKPGFIPDRIPRIIGVQVENCEAVRVSDKEALSARDILASNGIFVEPSGAVSYAGVLKKKLSGTVVAVATGHGLKDMIRI
jgi:threonine synthase